MDVSIIIVSWNTKDILRESLESVFAQAGDVEFETIVVDNGSADGSAEMVRADFSQAKLISNNDNRGFAAANNQGIKISTGRYILLLNSDTIVLDRTIAKTVRFADEHKEAAVVGCRILNKDRTLQPSCFMFPSILNMILSATYLYKLFPKSRFFAREQMGDWDREDQRQVDTVTGCYMLVRIEAIDQCGMLDEGYFVYCEETDWCWRFKKAGWVNLFTPDAEIIHLGGASSAASKPAMILQLRGSLLYFFRKNKSFIEYAAACLLVALFFGLRVPYWFLKGLLVGKNRKESFQVAKVYCAGFFKALAGGKSLCVKRYR